jgi:GNAT superfamily N-acetyltransferase
MLSVMNDLDLSRVCHIDLAAGLLEMTLLTDGGSASVDGGAVMCAAPSPVPLMVNAAIRVCPDASAEHVLDAAARFFAAKARGFTLYVHETDTDLATAGTERGLMQIVERYPQMVCRQAPPARAGAERVSDPVAAATYWDICRSAYPSLGVDAAAFTGFRDALLLEPHVGAFIVADEDGTPAACAMATLGHGIATLWWVACEPGRRKRGLAATATTAATRWAFDQGAAAVSLQASSMGEALYRALGYEDLTNYRLFLKPRPGLMSELPGCDQRSRDAHHTCRR